MLFLKIIILVQIFILKRYKILMNLQFHILKVTKETKLLVTIMLLKKITKKHLNF